MVNVVRYADDFIITGRSPDLLEHEVLPLVEQFLQERGLELSTEKTSITHIDNGFDFLGQNIRKYNGKLLIKPSKNNLKTFLAKVRAIIKENKQVTAGRLILKLNPVIRGWAQYHQHVVSKAIFSSADYAIYDLLRRWSIRRHPKKSKQWIIKKYIRAIGGRRWNFHGEAEGRKVLLYRAQTVPIRRHRKVKGEANPYDPAWELYFEERLGVKMARTLHGRRRLLRLWKEQNGICPVCNQMITEVTGWHNHHIIQRAYGGADTETNCVVLHPTCHSKVHGLNLSVTKPRPSLGEREA